MVGLFVVHLYFTATVPRIKALTTATKSPEHSRRNLWRVVLLLLVITPFLPEIVVVVTIAVASLMGCQPGQKAPCFIVGRPANDIIALALQVGAGFILEAIEVSARWVIVLYAVVTAWLVVCYIVLTKGWVRTSSRIMLGFVVALIFALLPYFGPLLTVLTFANDDCEPTRGGGPCVIFDYYGTADYSPVHDVVVLAELYWDVGAVFALAVFGIYVIFVIFSGFISRRRARTSASRFSPPALKSGKSNQ